MSRSVNGMSMSGRLTLPDAVNSAATRSSAVPAVSVTVSWTNGRTSRSLSSLRLRYNQETLMTDYPSIKPEDVREGDVVRAIIGNPSPYAGGTVQGNAVAFGDLKFVCDWSVQTLTDLRLVSRPTPPEPPLRVGDFVRTEFGKESQITEADARNAPYWFHATTGWFMPEQLTRIEPPVGWPVGVPTEDGGTRWWACHVPKCNYHELSSLDRADNIGKAWADLLAAGGVPALAVTR